MLYLVTIDVFFPQVNLIINYNAETTNFTFSGDK